MRRFLSHILWPGIMIVCLAATHYAMSIGHGVLGFNLIYLCLAVSLFFLERYMPHERAWLAHDGQMKADLAHTLLNKGFVQVLVVVTTIMGLAKTVGDSGMQAWPSSWPMPFQIILGLIAMEFGLYWKHRLSHEKAWLWPYHAVHHSVLRLWFFNTGRFHVVDTLMSIAFSLPLMFLLGVPNEIFSWVAAITAYIGMLTHCNVEMRCDFLTLIFNTPSLHRWHHSRDLSEGNKNYGENITLFDHLFGTYFFAHRRPPADIGIKEPMPANFIGQLKAPFFMSRKGFGNT